MSFCCVVSDLWQEPASYIVEFGDWLQLASPSDGRCDFMWKLKH